MVTRAELEDKLARTQDETRKAAHDLEQAQARRAQASANWGRLVDDRRKAHADRRRSDSRWDHAFADRRKAQTDRRRADNGIASLTADVAARHGVYLARTQVEAECAIAEAKLNAAIASQAQAAWALENLNRQ